MFVPAMRSVVVAVANAMIGEALLPNQERILELTLGAVGKAAFDVLRRLLQGNIFCGRDDRVDVVGHDDEFVKKKALLLAIVLEDVDQQSSHSFGREQRASSVGDGGDEERADFLWSLEHWAPGL